MIKRFWSGIRQRLRRRLKPRPRLTLVMTIQCRDLITAALRESLDKGHEGIVYFVGLTTGTTTLAVSGFAPVAVTTPHSVDVKAVELGKVIRIAATAGLQVVGQLHTHPRDAHHSAGDLTGMRIRYPGYFSVVVPDYGSRLPSLEQVHTLMWTGDGFQEIAGPIRLFDKGRP